MRKYYTLGGQTVAVRAVLGAFTGTNLSASVTYLQGDRLGSVSVAVPQSGPVATQEFDPWGRVRSSTSIPQTRRSFTGQHLDETGLLFYNARYYDPAIGRFISADTIVPRPQNPQELNRYSYANNNPLRYTDPSGHCVWDACILEIGIAVALIVAIAVVAADSGGRHAAANPIPWCRYINCLGDGSSPQQNAQFNSDTGGQINPNTPDPFSEDQQSTWENTIELGLRKKDWTQWNKKGLTETDLRSNPNINNLSHFRSYFQEAATNAKHIRFDLRGMDLSNIRSALRHGLIPEEIRSSITDYELYAILRNSEYFNKTTFYWGSREMTRGEMTSFYYDLMSHGWVAP